MLGQIASVRAKLQQADADASSSQLKQLSPYRPAPAAAQQQRQQRSSASGKAPGQHPSRPAGSGTRSAGQAASSHPASASAASQHSAMAAASASASGASHTPASQQYASAGSSPPRPGSGGGPSVPAEQQAPQVASPGAGTHQLPGAGFVVNPLFDSMEPFSPSLAELASQQRQQQRQAPGAASRGVDAADPYSLPVSAEPSGSSLRALLGIGDEVPDQGRADLAADRPPGQHEAAGQHQLQPAPEPAAASARAHAPQPPREQKQQQQQPPRPKLSADVRQASSRLAAARATLQSLKAGNLARALSHRAAMTDSSEQQQASPSQQQSLSRLSSYNSIASGGGMAAGKSLVPASAAAARTQSPVQQVAALQLPGRYGDDGLMSPPSTGRSRQQQQRQHQQARQPAAAEQLRPLPMQSLEGAARGAAWAADAGGGEPMTLEQLAAMDSELMLA